MWQAFADFSRLDKLSGGPDSHMTTMVALSQGYSPEERAWRMLVYVAVYNVPMALVILNRFPTPQQEGRREWIAEHWDKIILRRERRRPVGSPTKLADCLDSCAQWIGLKRLDSSYETLWADVDRIRYFGRYAKIKSLEAIRRVDVVKHTIPDLRAHGADSPREGLALLWPEHEELLNRGGNRDYVIAKTETIATTTQQRLSSYFGVELSTYELQTLICDFKQVVVTQRQYPGRSVDSEMTYAGLVKSFDVDLSPMFAARKQLFPLWALAEVEGWPGVREELGEVYAKHGYMWSDFLYDYRKTTDLAHPVSR